MTTPNPGDVLRDMVAQADAATRAASIQIAKGRQEAQERASRHEPPSRARTIQKAVEEHRQDHGDEYVVVLKLADGRQLAVDSIQHLDGNLLKVRTSGLHQEAVEMLIAEEDVRDVSFRKAFTTVDPKHYEQIPVLIPYRDITEAKTQVDDEPPQKVTVDIQLPDLFRKADPAPAAPAPVVVNVQPTPITVTPEVTAKIEPYTEKTVVTRDQKTGLMTGSFKTVEPKD